MTDRVKPPKRNGPVMRPASERFAAFVSPEPNSGCHLWTGHLDPNGFGHIGAGGMGAGSIKAHRLAWEMVNGPIPAGMVIRHRCGNRSCVNPDHMAPPAPRHDPADDAVRFMSKVAKDAVTGCWIWKAFTYPSGYGCFCLGRRSGRAHRAAWELFRGPIPQGLFVCHHCDVPACVNPDHLFLGRDRDNVADRDAKGRQAKGESIGISRLDAEAVRAMRRMLESGEPPTRVAARFGVHRSTVRGVRDRLTWAWVSP